MKIDVPDCESLFTEINFDKNKSGMKNSLLVGCM